SAGIRADRRAHRGRRDRRHRHRRDQGSCPLDLAEQLALSCIDGASRRASRSLSRRHDKATSRGKESRKASGPGRDDQPRTARARARAIAKDSMGYRELVTFAPLIALLTWAAAIDVRARRIPNWLTFPLIATGLAQSLLASSRPGPWQSLAGIGAGFGLT